MKFMIILALFVAYAIIAVLRFAYLTGKHGSDGPDGLLPIFGAIGWPVFMPLGWLLWGINRVFSAPVSHLYQKGRRDAGKVD